MNRDFSLRWKLRMPSLFTNVSMKVEGSCQQRKLARARLMYWMGGIAERRENPLLDICMLIQNNSEKVCEMAIFGYWVNGNFLTRAMSDEINATKCHTKYLSKCTKLWRLVSRPENLSSAVGRQYLFIEQVLEVPSLQKSSIGLNLELHGNLKCLGEEQIWNL